MIKKFTLLLVMLLGVVGSINAKSRTTTLWKDTYTGNIEIPVASLVQGATITVSASVTASENADDKKLRIFYCKNNNDWTQTSFSDISDWVELTVGETSHSFTVTEAAMNILNDNTETTGSRGIMYIGANKSDHVTISKITMTETFVPTSVSDNLLTEDWASSKETAKIFNAVNDARIGDVLQFTVSTTSTWTWVQFKLTDKDGNVDQFTGEGSELQGNNGDTSFTLEFTISTLNDLWKIMNSGFGVIQTGNNAFTLKAVKLLSYEDSYDYTIDIEMNSDGYMTYSNSMNLDFSGTGLTPYYASEATVGTVTLTSTTTTWNWQGYILRGPAGPHHPKVVADANASYPSGNLLKGNVGESTVKASESGDTNFRYIFAKKKTGDANIGFYKLTSDHTLAANKAYLETPSDITPSAPSRGITLDFGDGTTAILNVISDKVDTGNVREDGVYYTLQGTRVQNPSKGLYILNGKKVIVK